MTHTGRISITNQEVLVMFQGMMQQWFRGYSREGYDTLLSAFCQGDIDTLQEALEELVEETFSYFDVGGATSGRNAERFYHGFMLGLVASLRDHYEIRSNRESGYGRYDCMLLPRSQNQKAIILEFKVKKKREKSLEDSALEAIRQIHTMNYVQEVRSRGYQGQVLCYGIALDGKQVCGKTF